MENNSHADGRVGKRLRVFGTRKDFGTNEKIKNWKRSELNEILGKHKKLFGEEVMVREIWWEERERWLSRHEVVHADGRGGGKIYGRDGP